MAVEILDLSKSDITTRAYNNPEWRITTFEGGLFPVEELPFQKVRDTGKAVENVRHAIVWPEGRTVCLSINASPLTDANGGFAGIVAAIEDITAAVESERALGRQSRANQVLTQCNKALIRATDETSLLREVCRIVVEDGGYRLAWVGYAEEDGSKSVEPVAQCGFEEGYLEAITVTWDETDTGHGPTGTAIRTGQPARARNIASDPTYAPWRDEALKRGYASSLALPLIANSHTLGALCIYAAEPDAFDSEEERLLLQMANDLAYGITTLRAREERTRTLAELKASREDWRRIFNSISDPVMILDLDQNILTANPATEIKLGLPLDRIYGRKCYEVFHLIDEAAKDCPFKSLIESGGAVVTEEAVIESVNGTFLVTVSPIFDSEGKLFKVLEIAKDITERKRAEEALAESEEKYRNLIERSNDGILIIQDGLVKFANVRLAELWGGSVKELLETPMIHHIHPDERDKVIARYQQRMANENVPPIYETVLLKKDLTSVHVEINAGVLSFKDKPADLIMVRDITGRVQAEEEQRESETKLRAIFEQSRDAIGVSRAGTHVMVNPAYVKLFGYENESELFGTSILNLIAPDERDKVAANVWRRVEGEGASRFYETRGLRKDGTKFDMEVNVSIYELEGEVYTLVILRDVTEHKILEESLRQAQKMESVGRLAGGVAHDFNNFLTAVEGYIDLALLDLPDGSSERKNLLEARHSAERAANLTRQLLLFSRREPLELKLVNLSTIVIDLIKMLERLIGEQYSIVSNLEDDLPTVKADAGQIEQVLMNLVVNARDAIASGGEIEIGTTKMQIDETYVQSHLGTHAGEFVRLNVRDTGSGMDADTLSHIFDPFFSTKGAGTGTGLGLSVVYGIITQHGGWLDVETKPGSGSTFSIFLPAVPLEVAEADAETIPTGGLWGHGEKILLVEDDESVRVLADKMLSSHDYTVFSAASAEEALDLFEEESGEFDMVFSDVILPGMDGTRLIERLIELKPELRVLLASGFVEGVIFQTIREKGYRFLEKPYALTDLLRQVREVLEAE